MYNVDTKNLTDNVNQIQTDNEFLIKYIKTCVIYDTVSSENHKAGKTAAAISNDSTSDDSVNFNA